MIGTPVTQDVIVGTHCLVGIQLATGIVGKPAVFCTSCCAAQMIGTPVTQDVIVGTHCLVGIQLATGIVGKPTAF